MAGASVLGIFAAATAHVAAAVPASIRGDDWSTAFQAVCGGIGAMLIGAYYYFRDHKRPSPNADIAVTSAALFSDVTQIKRMIAAMECVADWSEKQVDALEDNTRSLDLVGDLLKDDAKARLEAQIERRLRRERGERE